LAGHLKEGHCAAGAAAVGMAIGINRELRGKPTARPRSAFAYAF